MFRKLNVGTQSELIDRVRGLSSEASPETTAPAG
jgi:hypothetical protein